MLLSLVQIKADTLKLKKLIIEDFIGVMDLNLIDDLFIIFSNKVRNFSLLPSYSNILEYENFIYRYIYLFIHGGISALDELQFDTTPKKFIVVYYSVYCEAC